MDDLADLDVLASWAVYLLLLITVLGATGIAFAAVVSGTVRGGTRAAAGLSAAEGTGDDPEPDSPALTPARPPHTAERALRAQRTEAGQSLTAAEARCRRRRATSRLLSAVASTAWVSLFVWGVAAALEVVTPSAAVVGAMLPATAALGLIAAWVTRQAEHAEAAVEDSRRVLHEVERDYDEAFQRMLDHETSR